MPDLIPAITPLKIFIASSGEMNAERDECAKVFKQLRVVHQHLFVDSVDWNYDMPDTSTPARKTCRKKSMNPC